MRIVESNTRSEQLFASELIDCNRIPYNRRGMTATGNDFKLLGEQKEPIPNTANRFFYR